MAHILIFEDDTRLSAYWKELLEAESHSVSCCDSIEGALMEVEQTMPDLVIADMLIRQDDRTLPEGGLTLITKLKLRDKGFRAPIIGVSGRKKGPYLRSTPLEIAVTMGIDAALYKPISADHLLNTVSFWLEAAAVKTD